MAISKAVGRILGAEWIDCISRSFFDDSRGISVDFHEEASPTSLRERLAKNKNYDMIYAGAFLDVESDSKREREPRGCKYKKKPSKSSRRAGRIVKDEKNFRCVVKLEKAIGFANYV